MTKDLRYVVDTDVISETTKPRPLPSVVSWLSAQAAITLSAVTVFELDRGVQRLPSGKKRQFLEAWLAELLRAADEVLPFDAEAALAAAALEAEARRKGRSIDTRDLFILATVKARGARLATRNIAHFRGFGVEIYDPVSARGSY